MNKGEDKERPSIRRIMVALDASPRSGEIIETAAELAARFGSELTGLFVEDINLLRLTELPFVREVSYFSPTLRSVDRTDLERQLRAQAAWMRRVLGRAADRLAIPWEFRVVRGAVAMALLAAGADADLLILGRVGRSFLQRQRIGSTARTLLVKRSGLTMILQEKTQHYRGPRPVVVVYDGSELALKALYAAINLVDEKDAPLKLILLSDDEDHAVEMKKEVGLAFKRQGIKAEMLRLINPTLEKLARMVRIESGGPVVLPCNDHMLHGEALCALMNQIPNPVLVVRH
jgi:nucleotide-binding universal stress UspA family protein